MHCLRPHRFLIRFAYWLLHFCSAATHVHISGVHTMLVGTPVRLTATPNGSIQGILQWSTSDASIATIEAAGDGLTAVVTPLAVGPVTFTATETTRSDGLTPATGSYATNVQAAHASSISITESAI